MDISSSRWNTSSSAALENCEQSAEAWRRQWGAAEAGMGDWGMPMYEAEYGRPPEPVLLGKRPFPHSKVPLPFPQPYAPPLATSRTSGDVFVCSVQILLVRTYCQRNRSVSLLIKEFLCVVQASFHPRVPCSCGGSLLSSLHYVV